MTFGLVSAIGIMIVEMLLFIRRATQMEMAFEKKPSALQEANAQMRSGALLTSSKTVRSHIAGNQVNSDVKTVKSESITDTSGDIKKTN